MAKVTELGYLTFGVSDLDMWEKFASQVLGFDVRKDKDDDKTLYLRMDYWHHRIRLVEDPCDDVLAAGLRVAGVLEFREMVKQLKDGGVDVRIGTEEEAEERKVLEVMFITDPNGYALEVFHGPLVQFDKPFHPGRGMHGRYKTGNGGLGHMMQNSRASFDDIHAFYTLLGMRGSVEYKINVPGAAEKVELLFFHCNDRQHTIAFGGPSEKRVNHTMFEVERLDDVGLTHDIVKRTNIPVIIQPGSHANDQMFSFYVKNPSGFMTEIGWGGRQPTGQSEYYQQDMHGHDPVIENMKSFMVPA